MDHTCTIEFYVHEVFFTNRDSTEATSMVSGTRLCQQLCSDGGAAFSSHIPEWPHLDCVYAWVVFFTLCLLGSCQTTCAWLLIKTLTTRSKPTRLRSTVFRPRNPHNLQEFKRPRKSCLVLPQSLLQCFLDVFAAAWVENPGALARKRAQDG